MEEVKNNTGQNLGIAALVTAVITFVLAVIPCVGLIAIIPGIIAIVLASVGLTQASRNNSPRGVLIAGLIIAVIAAMISFSQIFVVGKFARNSDKWPNNIQNIINDVQDNVSKEIDDANVSIKVEGSNGEKVEINVDSDKSDKVKQLEELEGTQISDSTLKHETVPKKK
jgi:thiol:disulfide interchange protein